MREMKDSGIEWIKLIPKSWNVRRGKTVLSLQKRSPEAYGADEVITCFRDGEVTLRKNRREEGFTFSDKEIGYQGILKGDLVIHGMDGFAGAIGISDSDGKASPVLVVCDSSENKRFLMYYLRMLAAQNVFLALATGIRERSCDLRWNKVAELLFPIPPHAEQDRIVNYLDNKCSAIDTIIAKQEQIIERLKEYKLSLITEAVTKGLTLNVEMKDSGVSWIGTIPAKWSVAPLTKMLKSIVDYRGKTPVKVDEGVFLVTAKNIKNGMIDYNLSQEYIKESDYEEVMHRGKPEIGDVLFTTEAPLGQVANADRTDIALAQRIIKFNTKESLNSYYLKYWIMGTGFQQFLTTLSTGSTATGIKASKLFMLPVVIPDRLEQDAIVKYLDLKCQLIDKNIEIRNKEIFSIKQFRKSLIYEVVTGKKEV